MKVIGKTIGGQDVVAGLAKLYFQDGLPLSVIFDTLKAMNKQPAWPMLYTELKDNGMTHERIMHLLNEHVFESYGKEYRDVVIQRLEAGNKIA